MNKKIKTFKFKKILGWFLASSLTLGSIGAIASVPYIVAKEVIHQKELTSSDNDYFPSAGDCRLVNLKLAYENNYDLLYYKTKRNTLHVIAVDENNIVHDISRGKEPGSFSKLNNMQLAEVMEKNVKLVLFKRKFQNSEYVTILNKDENTAETYIHIAYSKMGTYFLENKDFYEKIIY